MCAGRMAVLGVWVVLLVLLSIAPPARGGLAILSHDIVNDEARRETTFSISFDRPVDFYTVTPDGNPLHGFQYFFDTEPGGFEFAGEDVRIIRGVEIRFDDSIPVRESINETGEEFPNAEGWGKSRGEVPLALDDDAITFTVPWTTLGEEDGKFTYILFAFENGELTDEHVFPRDGLLIPLPAATSSALVLAAAVAAALPARAAGRRALRWATSCASAAHRGSRALTAPARSKPPCDL